MYALHALMMPLVVLLFMRWSDTTAAEPGTGAVAEAPRAGFAFALVTGLSFTNPMTTILLAPGLLIATAMRFGLGRALWRRLGSLALPFALGLLPYAWLPIRSGMNPRFDWGHVRSLREFLHHLSGADYQRWMFNDASSMAYQLRYLAWRLPIDFAVAGIVLAGLGGLLIARRAPALVAGAGAAFGEYRESLRTSESSGAGSRERLESARRAFLDALTAGAMRTRPIFSTGALPGVRPGWVQVPWHLALWIRPDSAYVLEPALPLAFRPWTAHLDVYAAQTFHAYAKSRVDRARYEAAHGRGVEAGRWVEEARSFDPHIRPERVGPQPLGLERTILAAAGYFRDLAGADRVAPR